MLGLAASSSAADSVAVPQTPQAKKAAAPAARGCKTAVNPAEYRSITEFARMVPMAAPPSPSIAPVPMEVPPRPADLCIDLDASSGDDEPLMPQRVAVKREADVLDDCALLTADEAGPDSDDDVHTAADETPAGQPAGDTGTQVSDGYLRGCVR